MKAFVFTAAIFFAANVFAELAKPVRILDIDIPHAAPFMADMDGDDLPDLIVGQYLDDPYTGARGRWFRNTGTLKQPRFGVSEGKYLRSGQTDMSVDEICYTGFGPQVVDFNGDGIRDVISGERNAVLCVFRGRSDRTFARPVRIPYIANESLKRSFAYNARLFATDWDSDGDMDLLVARQGVWLIPNNGSMSEAKFAEPKVLIEHVRKTPLATCVDLADWDCDGLADLIVGSTDGSVVLHRNEGAQVSDLKFAAPVQLVAPSKTSSVKIAPGAVYESPDVPARQIRICVTDYDHDGLPDLLLGDAVLATVQYDDENPAPSDVPSYQQTRTRLKTLEAELEALTGTVVSENKSASVEQSTQVLAKKKECAAVWQHYYRSPQRRSSRHGSVWLFRRLAP